MEIPVRQISDRIELFSIRTIEALMDGKPINHELHRHTYFFILAIRNGSGKHEIDFIDYAVGDHTIFILRPGQVHQLNLDKNCRGFLMEFNSEFYFQTDTSKQRLKKVTSKSFCSLTQSRFDRLYDILTVIYTEHIHKQAGYSDAIRANMDIFFIEYLRESNAPDQGRIVAFSYEQDRFEAFQELLETYVVNHIPVGRYAEMLGVSEYQLNRITKNVVGKTVSELMNEHLILESKRSLLATVSQVKDIAYSLGFEDVSYFIRFFKKHTGSSPEAFRSHFK